MISFPFCIGILTTKGESEHRETTAIHFGPGERYAQWKYILHIDFRYLEFLLIRTDGNFSYKSSNIQYLGKIVIGVS